MPNENPYAHAMSAFGPLLPPLGEAHWPRLPANLPLQQQLYRQALHQPGDLDASLREILASLQRLEAIQAELVHHLQSAQEGFATVVQLLLDAHRSRISYSEASHDPHL